MPKTIFSGAFAGFWRGVLGRRPAPTPLLPAEAAAELSQGAIPPEWDELPESQPASVRAVSIGALSQGPAPVGPSTGTLVAVSCYLPPDTDLSPYVAALVAAGYPTLEVRKAQHSATRSRLSASARVPHPHVTGGDVLEVLKRAFGALPLPEQLDVQTWPTY